MSLFVESLRRLYQSGRLTDEALLELITKKRITEEDYTIITQKGEK